MTHSAATTKRPSDSSPLTRMRYIEGVLRDRGQVSVKSLAVELRISEVTVRRYLDQLAARGLADRSRGGAVRVDAPLSDPLFTARRAAQHDSKSRIAKYCAALIPEEGTVFIGGGTTTCEVARHLMVRPGLTIFTSNLAAASQFRSDGATVFVIGGAIRGASCSLVGDLTRSSLSHLWADFTIMGADSISAKSGAITESTEEADVARQMIENTRLGVVCAVDASKWTGQSGHVAASPHELAAVVSEHIPEIEHCEFSRLGVQVVDAARTDEGVVSTK